MGMFLLKSWRLSTDKCAILSRVQSVVAFVHCTSLLFHLIYHSRCQWVLGHLTDDHLVDFFKRCIKGLKPNGVLVVKENLTSGNEVEKDDEDSSVTRPEELVKSIFSRAGLKILLELKQQKMPKGLYPVKMFVLRKK